MIATLRRRYRHAPIGLAFLIVMISLCSLAVAQFNRAFDSSFPISVRSARAGLLMDPGAPVKMRGVTVGHVTAVDPDGGGALLVLAINPSQVRRIPSNVSVQIVPPTVFGDKYVDLIPPATAARTAVARNAVISGSGVTVEVNDTFAHLVDVLRAASPSDVNAALSALATAVDGRGEELGTFLSDLDTYLSQINPSLDTLHVDLRKSTSVLSTYSDISPALLRLAKNASTTSTTVVSKGASLDAFLLSFTTLANNTSKFLGDNEAGLVTALTVLTPTSMLLAKYSGELPCFLGGLVIDNKYLEKVIGGTSPGINVFAGLLPTQDPYKYPRDLPIVGADNGPNCYGLPNIPVTPTPAHQAFNVGPDPYTGANSKPGLTAGNLAEVLFGSLSGLSTP